LSRIISILLLFVLLISCEKDGPIPSSYPAKTLQDYYDLNVSGDVSIDVWIHAGNHPSFTNRVADDPVLIRFFRPEEASNITLFINDSIKFPDSLALYRQSNQEFETEAGGLFGTFRLSYPKSNHARLVRIGMKQNDSILISDPITIRPNEFSTNTKNASNVSVETTADGRASFEWNGSFDGAGNNLVMLTNSGGSRFCAVETTDGSFLFHNLRNVATDFTPDLYDPRLKEGQSYTLEIFMTDNAGWMRNYRSVDFKMDSTTIQSFD
jgi:hypothetical protein